MNLVANYSDYGNVPSQVISLIDTKLASVRVNPYLLPMGGLIPFADQNFNLEGRNPNFPFVSDKVKRQIYFVASSHISYPKNNLSFFSIDRLKNLDLVTLYKIILSYEKISKEPVLKDHLGIINQKFIQLSKNWETKQEIVCCFHDLFDLNELNDLFDLISQREPLSQEKSDLLNIIEKALDKKSLEPSTAHSYTELATELAIEIFSYLPPSQLSKVTQVCKSWKVYSSDKVLWKNVLKSCIYGKEKWESLIGKIGIEPPLPKNLINFLRGPCPFWEGRKIFQTHNIVLIPDTIDNKDLTITELWARIYKFEKDRGVAEDDLPKNIPVFIVEATLKANTPVSHWVALTKNIIPGSNELSYQGQKNLITQFNNKNSVNYGLPKARGMVASNFITNTDSVIPLTKIAVELFSSCEETFYLRGSITGISRVICPLYGIKLDQDSVHGKDNPVEWAEGWDLLGVVACRDLTQEILPDEFLKLEEQVAAQNLKMFEELPQI